MKSKTTRAKREPAPKKSAVAPKKPGEIRTVDGIPVFCSHDAIVYVAELQQHPKNPNKHPLEQLNLYCKIIRTNGWRRALVVSKRSGFVVKGNGAVQACMRDGIAQVPVNYQDYESEAAEIADLLADNELARLANSSKAELDKLVKELEAANYDTELAGMLKEIEGEKAEEKEVTQIVPMINESYDHVVIFTTNATDWAYLSELLKLQKMVSYKKSGVGVARVITFKQFMEVLDARK